MRANSRVVTRGQTVCGSCATVFLYQGTTQLQHAQNSEETAAKSWNQAKKITHARKGGSFGSSFKKGSILGEAEMELQAKRMLKYAEKHYPESPMPLLLKGVKRIISE